METLKMYQYEKERNTTYDNYKNLVCAIIEVQYHDFIYEMYDYKHNGIEKFTHFVKTSYLFGLVDIDREYFLEKALETKRRKNDEKKKKNDKKSVSKKNEKSFKN